MSHLTRRAMLGLAAAGLLPMISRRASAQATPASPSDAGEDVPVSVLIQNAGTRSDRLVGATTPIAKGVALHATHLEHGQRVMRRVNDIEIPAGAIVSLEPGATHVMLEQLQQSLVQGKVFPMTLHFTDAGDISIDVRVRRKQDAAGVPEIPAVVAGHLTILHASAPPAPVAHG